MLTGRYVRSTFVEDQREFVEHLQIGKQIGKFVDMPKRPHANTHIFWVWNLKNLETWFHILKSFEKLEKLDLPGHCYGSSQNGPYGPQGPWAQPLFDCVAVRALRGFLFRQKRRLTTKSAYFYKSGVGFEIFAGQFRIKFEA